MGKTCNTSENSDVASRCKQGSAVAKRGLTCLSCASYRRTGCLDNLIAWPNAVLADCPMASYFPGSDEAEDWDRLTDHNDRQTNP